MGYNKTQLTSVVPEPNLEFKPSAHQLDIHRELYVLYCVSYACHLRQQSRLGFFKIQDGKDHRAEIAKMFDSAQKIIGRSLRFTNERKEQLKLLV
jgi:hypothetical protein